MFPRSWCLVAVLSSLVTAGTSAAAPRARPPPLQRAEPGPAAESPVGELPSPPDPADVVELGEPAGPDAKIREQDLIELRRRQFEAHFLAAEGALRERNYDLAIREYSEANKLQPGDPQVLLGRAHARRARTPVGECPRSAINDLRALQTYDPRGIWLEHRARLVEWMEACGNDYLADRLALVRELVYEAKDSPGRPSDIAFTLAKLEHDRSKWAKDEGERDTARASAVEALHRYRNERSDAREDPHPDALRLLGEIYQEMGELEKAIDAYEFERSLRTGDRQKQLERLIQDLEDEVSLREMEKTYAGEPTPEGQAAYEEGLAALRENDLARAIQRLEEATEYSPWFPKSHYALGLAYAQLGKYAEAVDEIKKATWIDRSYYQAHLTLAFLYKNEFGGTRDDAARTAFETALRLRPDLHHIRLHLGELYARTDRDKARMHYHTFLENVPLSDPDAQRARRALDELDRTIHEDVPPMISPPPEESLRLLAPELQRMISDAYLKVARHEFERAEEILLGAQSRYPDQPVVLNELAKVMYAQERTGDARRYWEQSLAMQEDQALVHEQLGLLLKEDLPEEALPHLRRAADLGSSVARYELAKLLWERYDVFEAWEQLELYFSQTLAGRLDLHWQRAEQLQSEMKVALVYGASIASILLLVVIGVPSWRLYRRLRGSSLARLLEKHPKSFPEVARILSLVRHEILKHNTAFLSDVGRALEFDAPDAEQRAFILGRRMFGDVQAEGSRGQGGASERAGIYGRFLRYVAELEQVARNHGERLNLQRKDPIFRPMLVMFQALAERADDLRNVGVLRHGRRLELGRLLSRSGQVLGRQAFERLSGLIQSLCIVTVDRSLIEDVYEQVVGEEQFAGERIEPVAIHGSGARVRVFRTDLEDILANVMRNSLRSSLQYAIPPIGLGIDLVTELDEITGLASLAIRIKDRSPEKLSNEMLRGRYVERGMGITVDLLSRYDGSIGVEREPEWEKAVVLRFFTVEDQADDTTSASSSIRVAS